MEPPLNNMTQSMTTPSGPYPVMPPGQNIPPQSPSFSAAGYPQARRSSPMPVVPPAVPPAVTQDAQVQIRTAAMKAARDYLMDRIYDDNSIRLAAEMSLAKFFLGEG